MVEIPKNNSENDEKNIMAILLLKTKNTDNHNCVFFF